VLVVDDGSRRLDERAWAYWSARPALLDPAADRSFDRVRVHAAGRTVEARLDRYRYRVVTGAALRRVADELLGSAPGYRLAVGHIEAVEDRACGGVVRVDGRPVEAAWVFDSVTTGGPADADAWLTFTGWEVEAPEGTFDPAVPTLMDFRVAQDGDVRFVYLLPAGPSRALVEHTCFGGGAPGDAAAALHDYLTETVRVESYRVLRREGGRLPLRIAEGRPATGHVLPIGVAGGMLKASTGYAYGRIQRDSAAISRSLVHYGHPFGLPAVRRRHAYLDAVLLDVLRTEPDRLERAFFRLFARNPGDRVLRFLDEDTSLAEEALLVATLPPAPFLRAMARRLGHRQGV
jgi:lycopene beta-cyclase